MGGLWVGGSVSITPPYLSRCQKIAVGGHIASSVAQGNCEITLFFFFFFLFLFFLGVAKQQFYQDNNEKRNDKHLIGFRSSM